MEKTPAKCGERKKAMWKASIYGRRLLPNGHQSQHNAIDAPSRYRNTADQRPYARPAADIIKRARQTMHNWLAAE